MKIFETAGLLTVFNSLVADFSPATKTGFRNGPVARTDILAIKDDYADKRIAIFKRVLQNTRFHGGFRNDLRFMVLRMHVHAYSSLSLRFNAKFYVFEITTKVLITYFH